MTNLAIAQVTRPRSGSPKSNMIKIGSKSVRIIHNLYCLNDVHKASGGHAKHNLDMFFRNQQTIDFVAEIERGIDFYLIQDGGFNVATKSIRGGPYKGVYACKELVYAYAAWIGPKFHLSVIRAFDKPLAASPSPHRSPKAKKPFSGIANGRYFVIVDDDQTTIKDCSNHAIVDADYVRTIKNNMRLLCHQLRVTMGEESASILGKELKPVFNDEDTNNE